jgi:hypothetical protein
VCCVCAGPPAPAFDLVISPCVWLLLLLPLLPGCLQNHPRTACCVLCCVAAVQALLLLLLLRAGPVFADSPCPHCNTSVWSAVAEQLSLSQTHQPVTPFVGRVRERGSQQGPKQRVTRSETDAGSLSPVKQLNRTTALPLLLRTHPFCPENTCSEPAPCSVPNA